VLVHFATVLKGFYFIENCAVGTQERSYCNSVKFRERHRSVPSLSQRRETLMPERYDERTVETPVQARQGVTGHNVRYVLAFSTCGVIAAFVIIYFLFFR
jgi:hypothetical protein